MSDAQAVMIHSKNTQDLLGRILASKTLSGGVNVPELHSVLLLSADTGSMISYCTSLDIKDNDVVNNLKIMGLLIKDKYFSDENKHCEKGYAISETQSIYTYEVENLHCCATRLEDSDLLYVFLAQKEFPYGLLVMKMKASLKSLDQLIGYKLG
ncbi:Protein SLM4 [Nakaseomyces bracarensis]|uniref:Protein SLM4 n=1 Tax=Nakaseomyces bracarensis TaxID=273131 RepID=A0ABR4NTX3_9SACH